MKTLFTILFSTLVIILLSLIACKSPQAAPENPEISTEEMPMAPTGEQVICIDKSKINLSTNCADLYDPICACDGKGYKNPCEARRLGVIKYERGTCVGCVDESKKSRRLCPEIYKPVCGCNGVTYKNACEAEIQGVQQFNDGPCYAIKNTDCVDPAKRDPNGICTLEYMPVCGCDNLTYGNECQARTNGVQSWKEGACPSLNNKSDCIDESKISDGPCTRDYNPVCGCDGKTYSNDCLADRAGVTVYVRGKCKEEKGATNTGCIDKSKIDPDGMCTAQYDPVCGCDGKTYSNDCVARINGVTKWVAGACPK